MDQRSIESLIRLLPDCSVDQFSIILNNANDEFISSVANIIENILFYSFGKSLDSNCQAAVKVICGEFIDDLKILGQTTSRRARKDVVHYYSDIIAEIVVACKVPLVKYLLKSSNKPDTIGQYSSDSCDNSDSE